MDKKSVDQQRKLKKLWLLFFSEIGLIYDDSQELVLLAAVSKSYSVSQNEKPSICAFFDFGAIGTSELERYRNFCSDTSNVVIAFQGLPFANGYIATKIIPVMGKAKISMRQGQFRSAAKSRNIELVNQTAIERDTIESPYFSLSPFIDEGKESRRKDMYLTTTPVIVKPTPTNATITLLSAYNLCWEVINGKLPNIKK